MKTVLGLVTIGQSPRTDLIPDVADALTGMAYVEHGALDNLDEEEISNLSPSTDEAPLVSRLRGGAMAEVGCDAITPYVNQAIARCMEDGANVTLVLCTGSLEGVGSNLPVFFAEDLAHGGVESIVGDQTLGVVIPLASQLSGAKLRWEARMERPVHAESGNPYVGNELSIVEAGLKLTQSGVQCIVLDCIGYTEHVRAAVSQATGLPVLLVRSIAVRLAAEAALSWTFTDQQVFCSEDR